MVAGILFVGIIVISATILVEDMRWRQMSTDRFKKSFINSHTCGILIFNMVVSACQIACVDYQRFWSPMVHRNNHVTWMTRAVDSQHRRFCMHGHFM